MNHLPRDAEALAARLADLRGVSRDEAIVAALEDALQRCVRGEPESRLAGDALKARLEQISRRAGALPVVDGRPPDEILGYDEFGLPT